MKDHELQELKPVYIHDTSYSAANEISLIDLALVLVRRKKMIAIIITLIIASGTIKALLTPRIYTYSTSIEIGSQIINVASEPFESTQSLLAKLQYSFIPHILKTHYLTKLEDGKKYKIKTSAPKDSNIIVLEIKGAKDQNDLLINLLQEVTKKAIQDHKRIYAAVKQNFTTSIQQAEDQMASLDTKNNNQAEKIKLLKNSIEAYKSQLANLRNTREISPPIKSTEPTGTSRKLIVIIAAFTGIFVAVFTAFFAEFIAKVKEKSSVA